jgi:nuclear transport factor 2 (NTF2) superfamily protein
MPNQDFTMRPPLPPFDRDSALAKVQAAEDGWNTRDPKRVALAYTLDTEWRNRSEFINGREAVTAFLKKKWETELDYTLKKELWSYSDNRIAVTFQYEWRDPQDVWHRSYGNELWEFAPNGLMQRRIASINDSVIAEDRRLLGV